MRARSHIISIFLALLLLSLFLAGCAYEAPIISAEPSLTSAFPSPSAASPEPSPEPEPIRFRMTVIGDVMCHSYQYLDAYDAQTGKYDFSHNYKYIKNYLSGADLTVGNLETSFGGTAYSGYPRFNTPKELASNLAAAGVDILNTANNHCLDNGFDGLLKTMSVLESAGIDYTGTYVSKEERDTNSGILVKEINGIRIAFISYTYGTNALPLPEGREYAVNLIFEDYLTNLSIIRRDAIVADIEAAKELKPDIICAFMHWGNEYETKQNSVQEELAELLFLNGVDVILGGHSHVLQPIQERTVITLDGEVKDVFVCYSLGNFISSQYFENTYFSAILNLDFSKDPLTGKVTLDSVGYVPIYTFSGRVDDSDRFYILDVHKAISEYENGGSTALSERTYERLKDALGVTRSILGEEYDIGKAG